MTRDLSRLLRPKSVAVIGGGAWCASVLEQLQKAGFAGDIWPVHPKAEYLGGHPVYPSLGSLPSPPDAAFVGINREATIETIKALSDQKAGGAVCFASGFSEVADGGGLNTALLTAAGEMPILGPNCYGLINALDNAMLWPDQHGCQTVEKGVAILTQSSNIAINLTMQTRALPIAYVIACGNQAQMSQADIALALLDDPRVTAIGLHIEGFKDLSSWQRLARAARDKGVPLVALKTGRSVEAQLATVSHTASLAGQDAGARALLDRFGIAQVRDLPVFLEALKILHATGPLPHGNIASISCSGGEAALVADRASDIGLSFPPLSETQMKNLAAALGPRVTLANPLDYHTYIWRDTKAMEQAFSAMLEPHLAMTLLIVDFPRADTCDPSDWDCAIEAAIRARRQTGANLAMVATLPELLPEDVGKRLMEAGVIPLSGLETALDAIRAAVLRNAPDVDNDLLLPRANTAGILVDEATAKRQLAEYGLIVPESAAFTNGDAVPDVQFPVALKGLGFAHKSEAGAVILNLTSKDEITNAAARISATHLFMEEMITDGVAELLIGVTLDPAHGYVLTIGAGGTLTEVLDDTVQLLVPASPQEVKQALKRLKWHRLLSGYRGKPAANLHSILEAIDAVQSYVLANADHVIEVEVNPLICTPTRAVAADALIRRADDEPD